MLNRILQFLSSIITFCKRVLVKLEEHATWLTSHPLFFSFLEKCEYYSAKPLKIFKNFLLLFKQRQNVAVNFLKKFLNLTKEFFYYLSTHKKTAFIHIFIHKSQVFFKNFTTALKRWFYRCKRWFLDLPNVIKSVFLKFLNHRFSVFFLKTLKTLKKIYLNSKNYIIGVYFKIKTSAPTFFFKKAFTSFYFFKWFLVYGIAIWIFNLTLFCNKFFFKNKLLVKKNNYIEYHPHLKKFIIFFYQTGNSLSQWHTFGLEELKLLNKERHTQKYYPFYFYQTLELIRLNHIFFFKNRSLKKFKKFYKFFKIKNNNKPILAVFLNFCTLIMRNPLIFLFFKKNTIPHATVRGSNFFNYIYICDILIKFKSRSTIKKTTTTANLNKNNSKKNFVRAKIWGVINTLRVKKLFKNKILYTKLFQKISNFINSNANKDLLNSGIDSLHTSTKQFLENYPVKINTQFKQLTTEMWPTRIKPTVFYLNIDQQYNPNQVNFFLRKIKIFNKNRYSRNRQLYRTGVYMCLYINVIFIYFYFFSFYRFAFVFGYLWVGLGLLLLSLSFSRAMKYRFYNHSNFITECAEFSKWFVQLYWTTHTKIKTALIEFKNTILGKFYIYWNFKKIFKLAKYKKNKNPHRARLSKVLFFEKNLKKYFGMFRRYLYKFNASSTNPSKNFWILIQPDAFQARLAKKKFFKGNFFKKNAYTKVLKKIYKLFSKHQLRS